jgi:RimJ/RimL family protein N-acetyltransferase
MSMIPADGHAFAAARSTCRIRPYRTSDVPALQETADDILVIRYMYAGFPHPYTIADAEWWVQQAQTHRPLQHFVVEVEDRFAGAISIQPRGANFAGVGILGYWLGRAYWGRGIATAAVHCIVERAFASGFHRIEASVYEPNIGSARVLEKNGFIREGRLRESRVGRDGATMDEFIFGKLKSDF